MVFGVRTAFDPAGPFVVATAELPVAGHKLRRGDSFPVDGFSEMDILELWGALKIDNALAAPAPDQMTDAELEIATAPSPPIVHTENARLPSAHLVTADPPRVATAASVGGSGKRAQRR